MNHERCLRDCRPARSMPSDMTVSPGHTDTIIIRIMPRPAKYHDANIFSDSADAPIAAGKADLGDLGYMS